MLIAVSAASADAGARGHTDGLLALFRSARK
jgi:hypothetical protein